MFAYLIIGIELSILYCVFWVVFIREPKPREVHAELWGWYEGVQKEPERVPRRTALTLLNNSGKVMSFLPSRIKMRFRRMAIMRHRHRRPNHCYCKCHEARVHTSNWCRIPPQCDMQQDINRQLAEKFLLLLDTTLNKFSVKIPY